MSGSAGQSAYDVKRREHCGSGQFVIPRLPVTRLAINNAERTGRRAERNGFDAGARQRRDISKRPGGRDQTTLARLKLGQAHAHIIRIGRPGRTVRIVATTDAARANAVRSLAYAGTRSFSLI